MDYSPAMSVTSEMTDEELDKYFATYVPLSNLPTPPPAKEHAIPKPASQPTTAPSASSQTQNACSQPQVVYATHLANLVPLNVSTHRPHASAVQGFLDRAHLPEEVVAFCACILDALSARFAATWREALAPCDYERDMNIFLRTDSRQTTHVNPDVIVLAALSLAHGFLVDRLRSSRHWSVRESNGAFTVREIEATKRAILQDMNYGLFRIQDDMVVQQLRDMQRNMEAQTVGSEQRGSEKHSRSRNLSLTFTGSMVWAEGVPTPEPSP